MGLPLPHNFSTYNLNYQNRTHWKGAYTMSNVQVRKGTEKPRRFTDNPTENIRVAPYCRVSTDSDDQLESYKTQVEYYNELVSSNPEWEMVGIYADEAITGTQTKNREDFKRMIDDCMNGKIDMVITKAISRFARNTVDTLTYVRQLKDKGIAVFFEEQNINTLTTEGEFLLTTLSSVAQQEVENISANVKFGHRARMKAGKMLASANVWGIITTQKHKYSP